MSMFSRLNSSFAAIAMAGTIAFTAASAQADQIVTMFSGNGVVGGTDSDITMLVGPANSGFASAGTAAQIINRHPLWLDPSAFSNPSAQWISTSASGATEGSSALFAYEITIVDLFVTSAVLELAFSVDNSLGGGPNQGVFINGIALPGSTGGDLSFESSFTSADISGLLTTGINTLYINYTDVGGPSGLLFSATITTTGSDIAPVPAPGALGLLGLGLAALGAIRRRRTV